MELTICPSLKTVRYASKLKPIGQRFTCLAITGASAERLMDITCIKGRMQVRARSSITVAIIKSPYVGLWSFRIADFLFIHTP